MDLVEDESFILKHPYFFEKYIFKFEGLEPEIQKEFETIVKSMSANISDNTEYVLTDHLYSSTLKNDSYYSISYLYDSMIAGQPLEIEKYKFSNMIQNTMDQSRFCCINARYIWKTKSCLSYYNQHFCCESCMNKRALYFDDFLEETNNSNFNELNNESRHVSIDMSNGEIDDIQLDQTVEKRNNLSQVQNENNGLNLDKNSDQSDNTIAVQAPVNGVTKKNEVNKNNDDGEIGELLADADNKKRNCLVKASKRGRQTETSIKHWKRARKISTSSSSSESENFKKTTRKGFIQLKLSSSSSENETQNKKQSSDSDVLILSEESSSQSSSNEEEKLIERLNGKEYKWWRYLPESKNADPNYKEKTIKCLGRGRDYSYSEKCQMIAYLVKNNIIEDCTSRKPWTSMHCDGYLRDRSVESLSNHFRKSILPNIKSFRLPKDIEKRFLGCRTRY